MKTLVDLEKFGFLLFESGHFQPSQETIELYWALYYDIAKLFLYLKL